MSCKTAGAERLTHMEQAEQTDDSLAHHRFITLQSFILLQGLDIEGGHHRNFFYEYFFLNTRKSVI